ncbi:AAA family ATPase [Sorangium sp. So ce590]|uniref:AAA family ATPase n=1 Tax=Sorangium sp. So ce590 TaxID=3133317 RepID=UPI003F64216E
MMQLVDYLWGETLYEGLETRVQRAVKRPSGERVVVKQPVAMTPSSRTVGRLLHEHQLLTKLADVPGVARPLALEQQGGSVALVLHDAGLRSLDRVLAERGRLHIEAALRLALGVCRVLQGVHAAGVMHKDVKPQNILVDETWTEVVLVDFGIASELAQEATEASLPDALEGTLAYISPEQTGRTARGLDARTDLYSLGVLLFEALSGRRPFLEKDPLALVHAHLAKTPPALDEPRLVEGVPGAVARLVERCLEKHPEQRYQTASGLASDLERALSAWTERGHIAPFALGRKDFSPRLSLPQTLVSRDEESREIAAAFERAAGGAVEVLLLAGPSGVGKTALVRSVYREIARAGRGLLLSGKHDQLGRSVPYAALAQAFSGLLNNLTASPKPVFESWRARIDRALGPNARVIADLVPELEWLMGTLAPVPEVPTEMAYNRLKLSWIDFVRSVTDASPPLVLFLDDLQWVDPASLELLKVLLTDVGRKHLLVIAAYRDNEVEPGHPLWTLVEAVSASGVTTPRLTVGPLSEASVAQWLTLALSAEPERVRPLSGALHRKTHGNPFFLGQLLLELHRQKRVRRDLEDGAWQWDQDAVERAAVTDNVVDLVLRKVVELPASTQDVLGQAACAGHSFSFEELTVLSGKEPAEVGAVLWPAVLAGLVLPSDGHYREAQALAQSLAHLSRDLEARYRFLHDRVQQAFYERIPPEQRARTHLAIGRRLRAVFERQGGSNQKQLEMVRHLNLGAAALENEGERKDLAKLNLRGARAAKANGSYKLQATLAEQAQRLLGERAWEDEPQLSVEMALERIEADYMLRAFDEVHRGALALLSRPLPAPPRLAAQELRVRAFRAAGQLREGESLGLLALAEQGIHYPESNEACIAQIKQLLEECNAWLDEHPEGFTRMPADPSPEHSLCDALEAAMGLCAVIGTRPATFALAAVRNTHQAMKRGALTSAAPFFIGILAHAPSAFLGDYRGSVRWTREGEQAAIRLASPFFPECSFIRGLYVPHESPVEQSRSCYQAALRAATVSGSFVGTSYGLLGELYYVDLWGGRPLDQVAKREEAQRDLMARAGDAHGRQFFALVADYAAFLRAATRPRPTPEQDWLTESSRSFLARGNGLVAELARILEVHLFLSFGEHTRALEHAEEAERFRPAVYGTPSVTDIPLWRGLAAAKCCVSTRPQADTRPHEERAGLLATLDHAIERFRTFTEGCAENFGHKLRLLEAERARLDGRTDDALSAYDDAIEQAHAHGFLHVEALAAQLCADFHLSANRERLAAHYLRQACDAYTRWGALALVAHLHEQHPTLLPGPAAALAAERAPTTASINTTDTTGNAALDVATTVRVTQALSSELVLGALIGRILRLLAENAGAERAVLALVQGGTLRVEAELALDPERLALDLNEPIGASARLPSSVVQYVERSKVPVVLGQAVTDPRFDTDPYLRSRRPPSLLAVPLVHQGRLSGVMYLEHAHAVDAFPQARIELCALLASQAATAVENATLYAEVRSKTEALQAANAHLEQEVEARTRELRAAKEAADAANQAKSTFLAHMSHELRTPLNGILGYAQILEHSTSLSPAERNGVQTIRRSGEHLLTLINDVLDLAKIEAGRMDLTPREVQLPALIGTVTDLCRVRAESKGLAFSSRVSGPPLSHVHTDDKRLLQVLLNLLSNAIKFTERGRVSLQVDVLEESGPERTVRFRIEDSGPGIAPEHLLRIFEPFEQVGSEVARADGTGLGLTITRQIVERMGGRIEVQSRLGEGSVFTVTLRLTEARPPASAAGAALGWEQITGYEGERRRVLVVDDHADNRAVLRDLLAPRGFLVLEAEGGEAALRLATEHTPALVVMDLAMPGMDGYEATRRLRQLPALARTVVLASSASVAGGELERSREAGCDDLLPKPVEAGALLDRLERSLELSWIREERRGPLPSPAVLTEAELAALPRPQPDDLARLLDLSSRGRVLELIEEAKRLQEKDEQLRPWLGRLSALAKSFQFKALRALLVDSRREPPI